MGANVLRRAALSVPLILGLACAGTGQPEVMPTTVAPTRETAASTSTPPPMPTVSPSPVPEVGTTPGSDPSSFPAFAAQVADALQAHDAAFFAGRAAMPTWTCLGDTVGVCKGRPDGAVLEGMPLTRGWQEYEVLGEDAVRAGWQEIWDGGGSASLKATAHRWGDNPLMPMAAESFMAILQVEMGSPDDPQVHVLFFEHLDDRWQLQGELIVTEGDAGWLEGSCPACFDEWSAW